jgi:hypothetical protein
MMNSAMLVVASALPAFFLTASTAPIHGWDGALYRNTINVESHCDRCGIHPNNEEDFDNSFVTTLDFRWIGPALNVNESILY